MDIHSIRGGVPFRDKIKAELDKADVTLALIGRDWAGEESDRDEGGTGRRIDDRDDLVRQEVATALQRDDVSVIPVLIDGATIPTEIPDDLAELSSRHACELRSAEWDTDIARICRAIDANDRPLARRRRRLMHFARKPAVVALALALLAIGALGLVQLISGGDDKPEPIVECENGPIAQDVRDQLSAAAGQSEPAVEGRVYYGTCGQRAWALAEFKDGEKDVFKQDGFHWSVAGAVPDACSRIPDELLALWIRNEYC